MLRKLFDFLRPQPPRPTALELAEANHVRLMNAREAAARERQRLIVEWLLRQADHEDAISSTRGPLIRFLVQRIEAGEPLSAARPEGRLQGPRSRR